MNRMRKNKNQRKRKERIQRNKERERGMKDGNLMTRKRGDEGSGQGRTKGVG